MQRCRRHWRQRLVAFGRAASRPVEHDVELARGDLPVRGFDEIVRVHLRASRFGGQVSVCGQQLGTERLGPRECVLVFQERHRADAAVDVAAAASIQEHRVDIGVVGEFRRDAFVRAAGRTRAPARADGDHGCRRASSSAPLRDERVELRDRRAHPAKGFPRLSRHRRDRRSCRAGRRRARSA